MEDNQFSRTALLMAYVRGYHAMHDAPKIFDDFLAFKLVPEEAYAPIEQAIKSMCQPADPAHAMSSYDEVTELALAMRAIPSTSHTLSRSRFVEDNLLQAVRQGVPQYVILGAGMDTFAFRRPEMSERLQVFEIDHLATQGFKRHRLAELGWKIPANLHFVPVDFTKENLAAALTRSPYDPLSLSFYSWLGVTFYLPRQTVLATLRAFADIAPAGSTVIFDYMDTDAFIPGRVAKRMQLAIEKVKHVGEPLITGFDPSTLAADLAPLGLCLRENLCPSDVQERYFQGRTDGYYACEHVHFAWAVVE